jgi:hypothetical protein
MSENSNPAQDYTVFGGWLLVWYWCLIIGGALTLVGMALPALISIVGSFLIGFIYAIGVLISMASICISAICNIYAAIQLKARKTQFFDTYVLGMLVSLVGGIVSSLFKMGGLRGFGGFISSSIGSIIGVGIGLCLCIMYFSRSVRVKTYFGCRPAESSQYWTWIKMLPDFITAEK